MNIALKAIVIWFVILLLAIANGFLREKILIPQFGASLALPLSGVLLALLVFFASWLVMPWFGARPARHFLMIGACWLLMTVAFEFILGRLVMHKDWAVLLEAYDPSSGNLWLGVLLVTAISPWGAARLRGLSFS